MKPWIAFLGGAALAAGIALIALKRGSPEPVAQAVTQQQSAVPQAEAQTEPVNPVPAVAPGSPQQVQSPLVSSPPAKRPVAVRREPVAAPPASQPEPAVIAPAPAPQAPVAHPPAEPTVLPPLQPEPKPAPPVKPPEPNQVTIAGGTLIPVRLAESLSSDSVQPGQAFQATLDQPLVVDGFVIAERGARVEGRVTTATQAGRVKGVSHLAIELTRLTTSDGQRVPIATGVWEKEGEQSRKSDAAKVAAGAGIGAALGAIFGGGKGAAIGAGSGGAAGTGVVLATRGKPVVLATETRISFKLKSPITVTEKR